jgi:hypothetical protein
MELDNQLFHHFGFMNSPQPLSALQRGAKKLHSPFFCRQENPACGIDEVNGGRGVEFMHFQDISVFLLLIPDSHKNNFFLWQKSVKKNLCIRNLLNYFYKKS